MRRNKIYIVDKDNKYMFGPREYSLGSFLKGIPDKLNGMGNLLGADKLSEGAGSLVGGLGTAVGGIGSSLISGGMSSGAGNAITGIGGTIGSAVGSVNPLLGGIISAGSGIIGGLTNAAFGTKVDQEKLNAINAGIEQNKNFISAATSFDDIQGPAAVLTDTNAYSGGWFSGGKARRKNEELKKKMTAARQFATSSVANNIFNLQDDQMNNALANFAAFGGPLQSYGADWDNGFIVIGNGGTHEQNPFDGVQIGVDSEGTPNLVEEGEVIYNDYVFSNRIKVPKEVLDKYKIKGSDDMTFADVVKKVSKDSEERPNDPISKRTMEDLMGKLMIEQESIREKRAARKNKFARGGRLGIIYDGDGWWSNVLRDSGLTFDMAGNLIKTSSLFDGNKTTPQVAVPTTKRTPIEVTGITPESLFTPKNRVGAYSGTYEGDTSKKTTSDKKKYNPLTALRYAPALGAGIGVFTDLMGITNKPDYSGADSLLAAASSIGNVGYRPIGDYLTYRPFDRLFYANQLGAQSAGLRRSIANSSVNRGQAIAGMLAADYNAQNQLGNLFRQAEEFNLGQRERVANFNRGTNMFNAENELKAQMASRELARARVDAVARAANLKDAIDARVGAARSANLTNLFDSLGNIGREEVSKSWINENPALLYGISTGGRGIDYKALGFKYDPTTGEKLSKAKGGYLTIKSKRRK